MIFRDTCLKTARSANLSHDKFCSYMKRDRQNIEFQIELRLVIWSF